MVGLPVPFRYEYLMAETIFSQLLLLPQPPFKPMYYTLVIIDLCKALPGAFPAVVAGAVRALFEKIADLDMECRTRLILWFSHHLGVAAVIGCKVSVLPTTYLGLSQGVAHNSVVAWDGVKERFRKRLAMWKRQYISKGGIRILIRELEVGADEGSFPSGPNGSNVCISLRRDGGPSPTPMSGSDAVSSGGLGPKGRSKGPKGKEKVLEESYGPRAGSSMDQRVFSGPSLSGLQQKGAQRGPLEALAQSELLGDANIELEFLRVREMETEIAQKANTLEEVADSALQNEVMRYEALSFSGGLWVSGNSSSSSMLTLGRTPEGEFFDHSGDIREICQNDRDSQGQEADGTIANDSVCWELVEFKGSLATTREQEGGSSQNEIQEERGEEDLDWQESSLARFSHFLGFSTDGLEKEILNFLSKIRKRREKIHSKGGVNDSTKRKVIKSVFRKQKVDLFCIQETKIQIMSDRVVRSLGTGRFLDWKALNACGSAGGILICWDKRALELLEWEVVISTLLWLQGERSRQGRITSAMRRFAEVVDDLGLVDLQLQGGAFTWNGGLNNVSRARLDRFLVSPCWLDQFSRVSQRRLPRPISDHFPILLEGGSWRRGPTPFRFENMWFKVEGFKDLIRSWWMGIEVREVPVLDYRRN
uniref:MIF4G-like type 1 domain-containing protein n=1 Tax=Vitis vinifera TaxID=29760 RepID=A5B0V2_VITVI|nr:hypothetical protein VITISV_000928 [Vitis vinifera]